MAPQDLLAAAASDDLVVTRGLVAKVAGAALSAEKRAADRIKHLEAQMIEKEKDIKARSVCRREDLEQIKDLQGKLVTGEAQHLSTLIKLQALHLHIRNVS